jgi:hypothetical protein
MKTTRISAISVLVLDAGVPFLSRSKMIEKRNIGRSLVMSLFLVAIASTAGAKIIYVDADASPGGDGQTWGTAYKYLQEGLYASVSGDKIWVANGIYKPDIDDANKIIDRNGNPNGTGDRSATFELRNGVTIKGGYAGFSEPEPNTRDTEVYETVLSGDLLDDDGQDFANTNENSYHVVIGSETNDTAVLDGFIVTAGNANGSNQFGSGGGMYNYGGSPTLTNCIFYGNSAHFGGGMENSYLSYPTLTNCTFSGNRARLSGGMGGGMDNSGSSPTLTNCTFNGNSVGWDGGGMYNYDFSNPILTNCLFIGNSPDQDGGGMANWKNCSPMLINCTFSGNSAQHGGGMASWENCYPTLINCIFWGNTLSTGGKSQIHDGYYNGQGCSTTVSYSNVQGGWPGEANIDADPYFADLNNGDYHLRSEAGRWDPNSKSWITDEVTSPCIDRGDPNNTVCDEPMPNGDIINMGAYGGTTEASMSIGTFPPLPPIAHWALDEVDGTIAYDSAGTYDGTLVGDPIWQPEAGMVGGALEFDGVDDYFHTRKFSSAAHRCLSVFAWIKGGMPGQVIISQKGGSDWFLADATDGSLMTELKFFGRPVIPLYSHVVITDGNWHHIGLVWDGSNRMLYVDDLEVVSDVYDKGLLNGELQIGAGMNLNSGTFWFGLIDEVRVYNVALSTEEIAALTQ